jgi:hypothetical protein
VPGVSETDHFKFNDDFRKLFNIKSSYTWHANDSASDARGYNGDSIVQTYYFNRKYLKREYSDLLIKPILNTYTEVLFNEMDTDYAPSAFPDSSICGNRIKANSAGGYDALYNGFDLDGWAAGSGGWLAAGHYSKLANHMGDLSGNGDDYYEDTTSISTLIESFEVLTHEKYYGSSKGIKENMSDPDYDYDAIIMLYKIEAFANMFGESALDIAMAYILGHLTVVDAIEKLNDLIVSEEKTPEEVKMMKACIDGDNLFTEDEDIEDFEKKTLTQFWTENNSIKQVLNKLYGTGSKGLNADEVSLWGENIRMYISKIETDGQVLSTKMQRMMQRCNETTSLATQMLKSIGDVWKQIYSNIR